MAESRVDRDGCAGQGAKGRGLGSGCRWLVAGGSVSIVRSFQSRRAGIAVRYFPNT